MMISLSSRLGRRSRRLWMDRQVTSTREPPSGMKRRSLLTSLYKRKKRLRPCNFLRLALQNHAPWPELGSRSLMSWRILEDRVAPSHLALVLFATATARRRSAPLTGSSSRHRSSNATPELLHDTASSTRHRSFNATPKLTSRQMGLYATPEITSRHRSFYATPRLQRDTEASARHRMLNATPGLLHDTEAATRRRSLHRDTGSSTRHRRLGPARGTRSARERGERFRPAGKAQALL